MKTDLEFAKTKTTISVEIPPSAVPGGSFDYITPSGKVILVSVPQNAAPGGFIDVPIDDEEDEDVEIVIKRSTLGAALAGGLIGTIALGPVFGVLLGLGAGYTAANGIEKVPKAQTSMKVIGIKSYNGLIKAKEWSQARFVELKAKIIKFNEERAAAAAAATATS